MKFHFLAVWNFFPPVQKLIFSNFWNRKKWTLVKSWIMKLIYLISQVFLAWTFFNFLAHCEIYEKYIHIIFEYIFRDRRKDRSRSKSRDRSAKRSRTRSRSPSHKRDHGMTSEQAWDRERERLRIKEQEREARKGIFKIFYKIQKSFLNICAYLTVL